MAVLTAVVAVVWMLVETTRGAGSGDARGSDTELERVTQPETPDGTSDALTTPGGVLVAPVPLELPDAPVESTAAELAWPEGVVEITLSGRVVDLRGQPWPGATAVFVPDRGTSIDLDGLPGGPPDRTRELPLADLPRVTTGTDGRFTLLGPWQSELREGSRWADLDPSVVITADGMAWQGHPAPGFRGRSMELGDLVLAQPGASLSLRVLDEHGAPLPGVYAVPTSTSFQSGADDDPMPPGRMANGFMGMTGTDGRLQVAHVWPSKVNFSLTKDGFEELRQRAVFPSGGHVDLGDVVLTAGRSVSGRVVDTDGKPVPGAQLMALSSDLAQHASQAAPDEIDLAALLLRRARSSPLQSVSEADGSFVLGGLSSSMTGVSLFASAEGFDVLLVDPLAPGADGLELVLQRSAVLKVEVVSAASGEPLADAQVQALCRTGLPEAVAPAFLREPFLELEVENLSVKRAGLLGTVLFVSAPGHVSQRVEVPPCLPGEQREVLVALEQGAELAGRVVDERGHPVEGALVGLTPVSGSLDRILALPEVFTDADGRFVFPPLPACHWMGSVDKLGYVETPLNQIDGALPTEELEVELERAARVTGTLLDAKGAAAVAHQVTAERWSPTVNPTGFTAWATRTDRDGQFAFVELEQGVWDLSAEPGAEARVTVEAGSTVDAQLRLAPGLRFTGRTRSGADALPQVRVQAGLTIDGRVTQRVSTRSGVDGRFALELPEPGEYSLTFSSRQGPRVLQTLLVLAGDAPELDVDFGTGSISGRVIMGVSGAALPRQVQITVRDAEHYRGSVEAAADGRFVISPLPAGSYSLSCSPHRVVPIRSEVMELGPGEQIDDVEFVLMPAGYVFGFVRHEDGEPFTGYAHLRRTDGTPGYEVIDVEDGDYETDWLAPGAWRLDLATFYEPLLGYGEGLEGEPGVELPFIAEREFELVGSQTLRLDIVARRVEGD